VQGPASEVGVADRSEAIYRCGLSHEPEALPEARSLVDLSAFEAGARALGERRGMEDGLVVFSLGYEPDGTNVRSDVLQHSTTAAFADSLEQVLFATLRPQEEGEADWGVRFSVELGPGGVEYEILRRVYCPPMPRDSQLRAMAVFHAPHAGVRYRDGIRERVIIVRVRVRPHGFIDRAEVARGASPGGLLERQLFDLVRQYSFYPATMDGWPITAWTEMPVLARN
jgi:hypothetical protein